MSAEALSRPCFVIGPIGKEDSGIRQRANAVFEYLIEPALVGLGYKAIRADHIPNPGLISQQIAEHILNDDLIIVDLTGLNPNVMYELATRHLTGKATIHLIDSHQDIPFDISDVRAIAFDIENVRSVDEAKKQIRRQIEASEKSPDSISNPLLLAKHLATLKESGSSQDRISAEILASLQDIKSTVNELGDRSNVLGRITRSRTDIQDLVSQVAHEVASAGALRVTQYDIPAGEATRVSHKLALRWEEFLSIIRQMEGLGLLMSQGASGGYYVSLSRLGKRILDEISPLS